MPRGVVTLGAHTIEVKSFHWPVAPLRLAIHETLTGRLIETDTAVRTQDIEFVFEGDEQTGWLLMTDTMKANIETLFQAGTAFTVTDWRGNSASCFFLEAPEFEDLASFGEGAPLSTYWGFRFRLGRVT